MELTETQKYYNNTEYISQSDLKRLLKGPLFFVEGETSDLYFEEKKYFTLGKLVDALVTTPGFVNIEFHISTLENVPSDLIKSIIQQIYDNYYKPEIGDDIRSYADNILTCCNDHNYQINWKDQTRVNKICEYYEYWQELINSANKIIVDRETYELAISLAEKVKLGEYTKEYFEYNPNKEILYQVPIYFEYQDVKCKSLLDMIIIDNENKTIQPIDIKTIGDSIFTFQKALKYRRYDIQAAFYTLALEYYIKQNKLEGYEILPFKFIVCSTTNLKEPAAVYTCTENTLFTGRYGKNPEVIFNPVDNIEYVNLNYVKGFEELLEDYKWYMSKSFETDRILEEQLGELLLDYDKGMILPLKE